MTSLRWSRGALTSLSDGEPGAAVAGRCYGYSCTPAVTLHVSSLAPIPASTPALLPTRKAVPTSVPTRVSGSAPVQRNPSSSSYFTATSPPTQSLQPQLAPNKSWCHQPARPFPIDADVSGDKHSNTSLAVGIEAGS